MVRELRQDGMDREVVSHQGKARTEGTTFSARQGCLDGILRLPAFHRWSYRRCLRPDAKQPAYHHHCHDSRQNAEIHHSDRRVISGILNLMKNLLLYILVLFCASCIDRQADISPLLPELQRANDDVTEWYDNVLKEKAELIAQLKSEYAGRTQVLPAFDL